MAVEPGRRLNDRMPLRRVVVALALVFGWGCAARAPRLEVGALASGVDAFLAAHPRAPEQEIRADEVSRTASASFHVVQVRGSERPHRHTAHDLTALVLRGRGTLRLGDAQTTLAAGDVVVVPRGAVHWFASVPGDEAVALVVFSPPLDAPDTVPVAVDSPPTAR